MFLEDTGGGVDFEPAPAGTHIARCVRVIDLGTHENNYFGQISMKHELFVMWELPHEMKTYTIKGKDGAPDKEVTEPFTVSKFYTASLSEKSHTRRDLETWRGRAFTEQELQGFDVKNILGAPCMLNVIHKQNQAGTKVNARAQTVNQMPKGLECPPAVHELIYFSLHPDRFDAAALAKLSDGLQGKIKSSEEYIAMNNQAAQVPAAASASVSDGEFDDIPF